MRENTGDCRMDLKEIFMTVQPEGQRKQSLGNNIARM